MTIKFDEATWNKILEADEEPIDYESIKKFKKDIEKLKKKYKCIEIEQK